MAQTPFECYKLYIAVKRHFTDEGFDGAKYGWKTRASLDAFDRRKDKYYFHTLSKKESPIHFLVANLIETPDAWIGDFIKTSEGAQRYTDWVRRRDSLTRIFKEDLDKLDDDMKSNFTVVDQHPPILKLYRQKQISHETMVVLCDLLGLVPYWNKTIDESVVWPVIRKRIVKYAPFVAYDRQKLKKVFKERFSQTDI
jgi:hypothetical protein